MSSSFHTRMSLYLDNKISREDHDTLMKELQSGRYDAEIAEDFYQALESPREDDPAISELDKERIFQAIMASEPFQISRMLRRQAELAKGAIHILLLAVFCFLPGVIRMFNSDLLGRRDVIITTLL